MGESSDFFPPPSSENDTRQVKGMLRCAHCGYDLRGTSIGGVCPECGVSVFDTLAPNRPLSSKAVVSFAVGMLSLFGCIFYGIPGVVLGILAIQFSKTARMQVQNGEASTDSLVFAKVGKVLGIIGLVMSGLILGFLLLYFIAIFAMIGF